MFLEHVPPPSTPHLNVPPTEDQGLGSVRLNFQAVADDDSHCSLAFDCVAVFGLVWGVLWDP